MNASTPPQLILVGMATGYWLSQCLYVAAKLGIADLLKNGQRSCEALAKDTHTHSDSLYRILRALASAGIFEETEPHHFQLTPLATYLQSDSPESLQAMVIMLGGTLPSLGNLLYSVQTGEPAFEQLYKQPIFQYLEQNPVSGKIFNEAMVSFSAVEINAILATYDFSGINKIVDVGGGYGSFLTAILQHNPSLQGILFDAPTVVEGANSLLEKAGVTHRCQCIGGNFFESVPSGGDAYLLKHIIHDWDDNRAITILQCCRKAIGTNGKLLLFEQVIPSGNTSSNSKLLDINMLVMFSGGRERTEAEYRELFQVSGFSLTQIISTGSDISIIEGIPL